MLPAATRIEAQAPAVRHRVLGRTGLKVCEVGYGTGATTDVAVVQRAIDLGVNFMDTARDYADGNAERFLGKALGSRRKEIILGTRSYAKDRQSILRDLDISLKELGTDYLDIWYLGAKDKPEEVTDDMLEAMAAAQKAGKFRFRGLTTHRLGNMISMLTKRRFFDVVIVPYNFAMGTKRDMFEFPPALESLTKLDEAGIGIVAMKVMAGGYRYHQSKNGPLKELLSRPNVHVAALRWALKDRRIDCALATMSDHDKLEEDLTAMSSPFGGEEEKLLASHLDAIGPLVCRMCGSCDGACPKGLPVADVVRYVTYAEGYGDYHMGREQFARLAPELQAVRCGDCSACAVKCPNGVRVRERAARAQALFC